MSFIDIAFLITVGLLVFNGLRNGAVLSLLGLLGLPIAFGVAYFFGPQFTDFLAQKGFAVTPLIAYIVLFIGTMVLIHIAGSFLRGIVRNIPLIGQGDTLLGGVIGFVEAWLIWLLLLSLLGSFLGYAQGLLAQGHSVPGLNIQVDQLKAWRDFYNETLNHSFFAQVNGFFLKVLPLVNLPQTTPTK